MFFESKPVQGYAKIVTLFLEKFPSLVNSRSKTSLTPLAYSYSSEIIPITHYEGTFKKTLTISKIIFNNSYINLFKKVPVDIENSGKFQKFC